MPRQRRQHPTRLLPSRQTGRDLAVGCSIASKWLFWRLETFARISILQNGFVYRLLVRTNPSYVSTRIPFDQARGMFAAGHGTYVCISSFFLFIAFALAFLAFPFLRNRRSLYTCGARCTRSRSGGTAIAGACSSSLDYFPACAFVGISSRSLLSTLGV